ncbi:facilitated trehalose transporter Tret1-like isoform X2 [Lycorma delicatula]|uniref:facilitated trehalose transporter Tret1-like isoform X2 n=1 Tax=Lycorma delicatula TaxID=130591 RepID=UPI003F514599
MAPIQRVCLAYVSVACTWAWTSPVLPRLRQPGSWLPITEEEGSWIGSFLAIGGIIGPLTSSQMLDLIGRKWTLILNSVLLLIGWAVLGFASNLKLIYVGRILCGISLGSTYMAAPTYLAEVSDDSSRKILCSTMEIAVATGLTLQYIAGPYLTYWHLIMVSSLLPLAFLLIFIWFPESPYHLVAKKRKECALKAVSWFRGISLESAADQLTTIESAVEDWQKSNSGMKDLFKSGNLKALYLTCGLMIAQQFSGIAVVFLYSEPLFIKSGTNLSPTYCAMIVGVVQIFSSTFALPLSKHLGYKIPLIYASVIIAVEQFVLGTYFLLDAKGSSILKFDFLPVTCLVIYVFTYSGTFGPLPWAVMGEMFPTNIKGMASGIVSSFAFCLTFLMTKFFTNVTNNFGIYSSFYIFSASSAVAFFFILFLLPDTRGMSLLQIQDILNKGYM